MKWNEIKRKPWSDRQVLVIYFLFIFFLMKCNAAWYTKKEKKKLKL